MFCPNCGKSDQTEDTYCRQCGKFLPDFDNLKRRKTTPEEHLKANSVLNLMTAIVSLTLAILLYYFYLGKDDTPIIIYITAGFLTAMFAWQVQTFWRTLLLKKQIAKPKQSEENKPQELKSIPANELLNEADFSDNVPASIAEYTTKNLKEKVRRSSQSEQ